jgi:hypothetical protein
VRINEELLERKISGPCLENRLTAVGDPPHTPRNNPLATKVDSKIRRPLAGAQSVYLACGIKATELVSIPGIRAPKSGMAHSL